MVGAKGRGHFKPREYNKKDGTKSETNDVERFYDFDPSFFSGQSASAGATPPRPLLRLHLRLNGQGKF